MKLVVRERAADDLDDIFSWIATDNPTTGRRIVGRLRERIGRLAEPGLSHIGRPGSREGTRELVESPYIIVYSVDEVREEIDVLAIFHGAQNR